MLIKLKQKISISFYQLKLRLKHSRLVTPLQIDCPKNMRIGQHVYIASQVWLAAMPLTKESKQSGICELVIDDGCEIGHFAHIYATQSIHICKNVLIADHVYIADNSHCFEDVTLPIKSQLIIQKKNVVIGENSWIGEKVSVLGASIGRNCVIGANSVVIHDIPDYCIAVGAPAKVIKKYDFNLKKWVKV